MVANIITRDLAENTNYKLIKNAYKEGSLEVIYYPRDSAYSILRSPNNRTTEFVLKELHRLLPNCKQI